MEQLPNIEVRNLRYFVTVAEELSFRKAAQRLSVTPSALSVQVKNLEILLEARLFKRDTAKVRLTVSGETLLRESRRLIESMNNLVRAVREAEVGKHNNLRIGIPRYFNPHFNYNVVSRALGIYHRRFPKINVTPVDICGKENQWPMLEAEHIHVGFMHGHQLQSPPPKINAGVLLITDVPIHVAMAAQHQLASKKHVTLKELSAFPLLVMKLYTKHHETLLSAFEKNKLEARSINMDTFGTCLTTLASGNCVALMAQLPSTTLDSEMVLRPIKNISQGMRLQWHAVWKADTALPQVADFINVFREIGVQRS